MRSSLKGCPQMNTNAIYNNRSNQIKVKGINILEKYCALIKHLPFRVIRDFIFYSRCPPELVSQLASGRTPSMGLADLIMAFSRRGTTRTSPRVIIASGNPRTDRVFSRSPVPRKGIFRTQNFEQLCLIHM